MNPVLFIDFDGVTHPEPSQPEEEFTQMPLIESVLREYPAVDIVVSSTWRLDWMGGSDAVAVEKLRQYFSSDIAKRVVGITPFLGRLQKNGLDALPSIRELECHAWIKSNRPVRTRWMALDDRDDLFLPRCPNLMIVDSAKGFMQTDEEMFRQHLTRITTPLKYLVAGD